MPGRGPLPKSPATRQRTNRTSTKATLIATPVIHAELPSEMSWHLMTRSWWATIWSSPMAEEWVDGDIPALIRLARLDHDFWSSDEPDKAVRLAAEIRQQQGRFGLTPMDRRSLQWEVHRVETAKREEAKPPRRVKDPRSVLRAIS